MVSNGQLRVMLPRELARFVASKVRSGEYVSEEEVIRDGLELLKSMETYRARKLQWLREEIQIGLDQANKGMTRVWDERATERIKAKGRRLLAARKNGKT